MVKWLSSLFAFLARLFSGSRGSPPQIDYSAYPDLSEIKRRPDLVARQVGLDVTIYDPASDRLHILNPVAGAVWHHLTPDRSFQNIVEALSLTYTVPSIRSIGGDLGLTIAASAEPPEPSPDRSPRWTIPDVEISPHNGGYVGPSIKSFTIKELENLYGTDPEPALFSDLQSGDPRRLA